MTIKIEQALHGYGNGHQLLSCSVELDSEDKRLLLVQSDLSGSNIEPGFDCYITGYPLKESNFYALARTWYASEMKRPGCVWTHTLLIKLADIGKFSDLSVLNHLFTRPEPGEIRRYNAPLEHSLTSQTHHEYPLPVFSRSTIPMKMLLSALYEHPDNSILDSAENCQEMEVLFYQIWSAQWPRLRRNFTFCTGALGFKYLYDRAFDLQITPVGRTTQLARESSNTLLLRDVRLSFDWDDYMNFDVQSFREFIWVNGADIAGVRSNMIPLIKCYQLIQAKELSLLLQLFRTHYPEVTDARSLKLNVFGKLSSVKYKLPERELVYYLLTEKDLSSLPIDELDIGKRFKQLALDRQLSWEEILEWLIIGEGDRFIGNPLDLLPIRTDKFFLDFMERHPDLISKMLHYFPELITNENTWAPSRSYGLQIGIYNSILLESLVEDWRTFAVALLKAKSNFIHNLWEEKGELIIYGIDKDTTTFYK